jgi:threonine dehydrogenase-like Zn-dependent dehydrogenase
MPEGVKRNRFHPDDRVRATLSTCGRGACTYLQQIPLMKQVLAEKLDPSPVPDIKVDIIADVPKGYAAMDTRHTIKVMVQS